MFSARDKNNSLEPPVFLLSIFETRDLFHRVFAADDPYEEQYDRGHKKNIDKSSNRVVGHETKEPQDDENDGNSGKHGDECVV